jgi:hypothetical protein
MRPLPQRAWGVMGLDEREEDSEEAEEEEEGAIVSILQR